MIPILRIAICLFVLLFVCGCESKDSPVPIEKAVDMCEYCRMTITSFRCAAEFVEKGKDHKFDDIGCMLAYAQTNNLDPEKARFWVMDYDSSTWVKGEEAYYVLSAEIQTPMGHGIIAFKNPDRAKEFADRADGEVLRLDTLFKMDWKSKHEH